jgi:hypothetical protein
MVSEVSPAIFCLDANALLFLGDKYPRDTYPDVWEALSRSAAAGVAVAPDEVLRELEAGQDNGACSWARDNGSMFKTLDSAQIETARQIAEAPGVVGLMGIASEILNAGPFVAALALSYHTPGSPPRSWPAVVSWSETGTPNVLWEVCKVFSDRITSRTPYELLRDINLDVPPPSDRGLGDLYGIWKDLGITDEDIADSKLKFGDRGL